MSREHGEAIDGHLIFAAAYDWVGRWTGRRLFPEHREYLARDLQGDILDLDAGTGGMFPYFAAAKQRDPSLLVHGIDPGPYMLRRAVRTANEEELDVDLRGARAESLPYADGSFDTVIASLVYCTIDDPERALREVHRVLDVGGEFRFLEHVRADGLLGRLHDLAARDERSSRARSKRSTSRCERLHRRRRRCSGERPRGGTDPSTEATTQTTAQQYPLKGPTRGRSPAIRTGEGDRLRFSESR